MLGRKLKPDEDVHHRNRIRTDFRKRNLKVLGHQEHGWISALQHYFMDHIRENAEKAWYNEFGIDTSPADDMASIVDSVHCDGISDSASPQEV
jgi:hypothetical protein